MYLHLFTLLMRAIFVFLAGTARENGEYKKESLSVEEGRKMKQVAMAFLLMNVLIAGCFSKPNPPQDESHPQDRAEEALQIEEQAVEPLTGLKAQGDIHHPVLMVMVNNHAKARPQTGLNRADLVFEILAEGDITRFAAFYHSQTEGTVGPVRSARPYYLDLGEGFDAVIAHAGGSPDAKERYEQPGYPSLDGIGKGERYFWREDFRVSPHNLYTSLEKLLQGVEENNFSNHQNIPRLTFSDEADIPTGDKGVEKVTIAYHPLYNAGYAYNPAKGQYVRYTQGEMQVDFETKEPIVVDNVLVIRAKHDVLDDLGRRAVDVTGSGTGWLFQKGGVQEIEWAYEDGFPRPYTDGRELPLVPGKTWVNVIPENAEVHYE